MKRHIFVVGLFILAVNIGGMFQVKHRVQNLKKDLVEINRQLASNKQAVHVLKAEWAYLNDPERIKELSNKYLKLRYVMAEQMKQEHDIRSIVVANRLHDSLSVKPTLRPILSSADVDGQW